MKRYKPRKVAKIGQNHKKCQKFTKNPHSFAYHMQKNWSTFINNIPNDQTDVLYVFEQCIDTFISYISCRGSTYAQKVKKTHKNWSKNPNFPNFRFFNTNIVTATPPDHLGR